MSQLDDMAIRKMANAAHEQALKEDLKRQAEEAAWVQLPQAACHALNALQDNGAPGAQVVMLEEATPFRWWMLVRRVRCTLRASWHLCVAPNTSRHGPDSYLYPKDMSIVLLSDGRIGKITQKVKSWDGAKPPTCYIAEKGEFSADLALNILQHDERFKPTS